MIRILIVEDDVSVQRFYLDSLDGTEVICALTIEEARDAFASNPDFAAIVMDACVPGDEPTTPPLVMEFRKTFTGPMIATSSDNSYNDELVEAGCNHRSYKQDLPNKLREILGLS